MKQIIYFFVLAVMPTVAFSATTSENKTWYRDAGEWIASRTVREGLVGDEPTTKMITDGKRYDVTVGKRIPIYDFNIENMRKAWSVGFDGGMLVTLFRNMSNVNNITFASENFDGFFGLYIARSLFDTIYMLRVGHVSSHLVDNNPRVLQTIPYSRFWNELIISHNLEKITKSTPWDIQLQGSLGLNFKSDPIKNNPRALLGIDIAYAMPWARAYSILGSMDARRPGVKNQVDNYSAFFGIARIRKHNTLLRPLRVGVSHHWGSDYRNQYYNKRTHFTGFEVQIEF